MITLNPQGSWDTSEHWNDNYITWSPWILKDPEIQVNTGIITILHDHHGSSRTLRHHQTLINPTVRSTTIYMVTPKIWRATQHYQGKNIQRSTCSSHRVCHVYNGTKINSALMMDSNANTELCVVQLQCQHWTLCCPTTMPTLNSVLSYHNANTELCVVLSQCQHWTLCCPFTMPTLNSVLCR